MENGVIRDLVPRIHKDSFTYKISYSFPVHAEV